MFTIKGKIILSSSVVFSLTLIIFAFWLYRSTRHSEFAKLDARLVSLSEELQSEIEEEVKQGTFPDSHDLSDVKVEGMPQSFFQVYDNTGKLIVSDSILEHSIGAVRRREYETPPYFANLKSGESVYRANWSPVEVDEKYPYILQVAAPLSEVNAGLLHLKILLMTSIPLAIIVSALAIYLFSILAFRQLTSMAETAKRISAANLHQRLIVPHARDELHSLSVTLNQMFERLELAFLNQKQFVADASHEIRTPLAIMNTELDYVRKIASNPKVIKSIDSCLEEIDRLSRMTESLLLLARLDSDSMKARQNSFRLDELVVEVVQNMMKIARRKTITIQVFIEDAVEIYSDIDLIKQVLINIIDNAIRHSSEGSEVAISLHSPSTSSDNSAEICIKDNGPGISDIDRQNIFKRFFRGENVRKEGNGSGLGLPIVQKLMAVLGGRIKLLSEVGKGTEVYIFLPLNQ